MNHCVELLAGLPLFADIGGVIQAVIVFIAIMGWILKQVSSAVKKVPQQPAQPMMDEPPAEVAEPARQKNAPLVDEIEQFLREAAQRRQGGPPVQAEVVQPRPPRQANRPSKRNGTRERKRREPLANTSEPVVAEVVESDYPRESVAHHVQKHLDTREFAERASHLTSVESDKKIDTHIQQAFDHRLGKLTGTKLEQSAASDAPTAGQSTGSGSAAHAIAVMLRDSKNLKSAVILNEIFQRPEHRW